MSTVAFIATVVVALLHIGFLYMETLGWNGMAKGMGKSREYADTTRMLALNQGFYNAGIGALLLWARLTGESATAIAVLLFIVVMAVVGAVSASPRIFLIQGVPALIALGASLAA